MEQRELIQATVEVTTVQLVVAMEATLLLGQVILVVTGGANGNTAGTAGTRGAGGGGGGTEPGSSQGGAGGAGEIVFRFLRI